jgi:prevent-host-death family protein
MADALPVSEVRSRLSELVDRLLSTHEPLHLTRHGRPVAVLVEPGEWERARAALEAVEDAADRAALDEALAADDGARHSLADVLGDLAADETADETLPVPRQPRE